MGPQRGGVADDRLQMDAAKVAANEAELDQQAHRVSPHSTAASLGQQTDPGLGADSVG